MHILKTPVYVWKTVFYDIDSVHKKVTFVKNGVTKRLHFREGMHIQKTLSSKICCAKLCEVM